MGVGVSIILMAAGAVLTWGITAQASGFDINAIGIILMVVGALGLLVSALFLASWAPFHERVVYRDRDIEPHDHEHIRRSA